jgi:hypothetical protein
MFLTSLFFSQACLLGEAVEDAKSFGWQMPEGKTHDWSTMVGNVQVCFFT